MILLRRFMFMLKQSHKYCIETMFIILWKSEKQICASIDSVELKTSFKRIRRTVFLRAIWGSPLHRQVTDKDNNHTNRDTTWITNKGNWTNPLGLFNYPVPMYLLRACVCTNLYIMKHLLLKIILVTRTRILGRKIIRPISLLNNHF